MLAKRKVSETVENEIDYGVMFKTLLAFIGRDPGVSQETRDQCCLMFCDIVDAEEREKVQEHEKPDRP